MRVGTAPRPRLVHQGRETNGGDRVGDRVDFERLRQIDKLFEFRWDAFVIGSLAEADGPMRFNQLAQAVSEHTGTRMIDSSLNQIKKRLINQGILVAVKDHNGHPSYALTDDGRSKAAILAAITDALNGCSSAANDAEPESQVA